MKMQTVLEKSFSSSKLYFKMMCLVGNPLTKRLSPNFLYKKVNLT